MGTTTSRRAFLRDGLMVTAGAAGGALFPLSARGLEPLNTGGEGHIKLSCAAYSYRKYLAGDSPSMTLDDFIDQCAAMKLDACEPTSYYFPKSITPDYLNHLKHRAFLKGLDISGTAIANNFCLPPGPDRDKQIGHVKQWIEYAAALDAPVIRIFSGSTPAGHTEEEARRWAVEAIEECCAYAGRHGVFLALENHGGLTAEVDGFLQLVEAVQSPWFGVNLDTGNFRNTSDPYGDLEKCAPYAITVQVKTEMKPRGNASNEEADLARIVAILKNVGYRGYLALEYEAAEEPLTAIPRYCAELRRLIS
jgi:sugar phosphate isomerase/epimerase